MTPQDKPIRRLTLRELLTDAERRARQLAEHLHGGWMSRAADLRELSRTVRKRSHFPTLVALHHSVEKILQFGKETDALLDYLRQELEEIQSHARREKLHRS
jgi:C4-dicarboxylate-specific signal transduction histidine kinase